MQPQPVRTDRLRHRVTRGSGMNRKRKSERKKGTVEEEDKKLNTIVQEEPTQ